jgi:uncharacterized protein YcfJ
MLVRSFLSVNTLNLVTAMLTRSRRQPQVVGGSVVCQNAGGLVGNQTGNHHFGKLKEDSLKLAKCTNGTL